MGVDTPTFDPDHRFVTSWLLPPLLLASLRAVLGLYAVVTIFVIWGWDGTHNKADKIGQFFSYFTDLTYLGITFYFLVAAFHTFTYVVKGYSYLQTWPRPLQALHSLYYTTIVTLPFLVTIVFWVILYTPPWYPVVFDAWSNVRPACSLPMTPLLLTCDQVSQHGLNSLFAIAELVLTTTNPPPWLHLAFLLLILALYLALAYITRASEGFYVYNFLNPSHGSGKVVAYVFGILATIIVVFLVSRFAIWMRKRFTRAGKRCEKDLALVSGTEDVEMIHSRPK